MAHWKGSITIAKILSASSNWKRYIAWKGGHVRSAVCYHVARMLACRTPQLGAHFFLCSNCHTFSEKRFRQVLHYGLFSNAKRTEYLSKIRQILAQRKKRQPTPMTWKKRRKAASNRKTLSCPQCGHLMEFLCLLFGLHKSITQTFGIKPNERIPPKTFLTRDEVLSQALLA